MRHKAVVCSANVLVLAALLLVGCQGDTEPRIATSAGEFTIDEVEAAKEYVEQEADTGHKFLIVWLSGPDGLDLDLTEHVYVTGDDGSQTESLGVGERYRQDGWQPAVIFMPPTAAKKFTLHWPGNEPIELVVSGSS